MEAPSGESASFQWKWVWITLGLFVVFYFIPLMGASILRGELGAKIIGGWSFGGILVIAGATGYWSRGVTIWEPAVAGAFLTILWYGAYQIVASTKGTPVPLDLGQILLIMIAVFGLSLVGAGLGEGIQNAVKQKKKTTVESQDAMKET